VIRFLRHKNLRLLSTILLVIALMMPYGLRLTHALEAHSAVSICSDFTDHLHEKTPHLDLLDHALVNGVDENHCYRPMVVLPQINTPQDYYTFCFVETFDTYTVSRGPPHV